VEYDPFDDFNDASSMEYDHLDDDKKDFNIYTRKLRSRSKSRDTVTVKNEPINIEKPRARKKVKRKSVKKLKIKEEIVIPVVKNKLKNTIKFPCPVCKKRFFKEYNLEAHMYLHTGLPVMLFQMIY
jgi:uncharacterized Zn-finger protein